MQKKTFLPQLWENVPSDTEMPKTMVFVQKPINHPQNLMGDVENIVQKVEARGIDIAPDYDTWRNVGFALANGLGEDGRDLFHRISRLHSDYDFSTTDKQFTNCLKGKGSGITIASLFHYAAQADIELEHHSNVILPLCQIGKTAKWIKPANELPHFSDIVYFDLPPFLQNVVANAISEEDRDVILLGAIGSLSVCFSNVCGVYDERVVFPNLYLFVVADAGMGKGALTLCRELVSPINHSLHAQSARMMEDYKRDMIEFQKSKKNALDAVEPIAPPQKTLIIPANSSSSSLLSILSDNEGIGLLFETEGDTLSQTLKSEHGNYSDILRKAFHHEIVSMSRRKDREYIEIDTPRMSVVLAGTPEQVRRLIPDAENGLLSRFIFYFLPFRRGIRDVFATDDVSRSKYASFKMLGEEFFHLINDFASHGTYTVILPAHLRQRFVEWLARLNDECCDEVDNGMQGIVRRLGLIAFRMMILFTSIRSFDNSMPSERTSDGAIILECTETDFNTILAICETLLCHSINIYMKLQNGHDAVPTMETGVSARRYALFHKLPDDFDKATFDRIVAESNENANTASKWLDRFIRDGRLQRMGKGVYHKL